MGFLNYTVTCFLNLHSTVETGIFQRTFSLRWLWTFHFCCLQQSSCVAACWRLPPEVSNDGTHSLYNELSALIKNVGITDLSEPFVAHGYFLPQSELARCTGNQILPFRLNVWFFLIFLSFPQDFRNCQWSLVSWHQMIEGFFLIDRYIKIKHTLSR